MDQTPEAVPQEDQLQCKMRSEPGGLGTKPSSVAYLLTDLEQVTHPQ